MLTLVEKGYVARSDLDSLGKTKDAAYQLWQGAKANLDQALHGDRQQQAGIYAEKYNQSVQDLNAILAQYEDLVVKALVSGEIGSLPAENEEYFNAYSPQMTIIRIQDPYFVFNLRETILPNVHKGDAISLHVPAIGKQEVKAIVGYIAPMGDFATLTATRATGDFELKTFEVRLYPVKKIDGLRPSMSAIWIWRR